MPKIETAMRFPPPLALAFRLLGLGLIALALSPAPRVQAQSCEGALAEATQQYNLGRFDEAIQTLGACLENADASAGERRESYQLLALTYWAKQLEVDAEDAVRGLLELAPSYEPGDDTPPPFRAFVAQMRERMRTEGALPDETPADVPPGADEALTVAQPIADVRLAEGGDPAVYDLRRVFGDADGALTYTAEMDDPDVAEATLEGNSLAVRPRAIGVTRCTVEARSDGGGAAQFTFRVNVTPAPSTPLTAGGASVRPRRRWRWVLLGGLVAGGVTAAAVALGGGGGGGGGGGDIGGPPPLPSR